MNNALKGLIVVVACVLFFFACLSAVKEIGSNRKALIGDTAVATIEDRDDSVEKIDEETSTEDMTDLVEELDEDNSTEDMTNTVEKTESAEIKENEDLGAEETKDENTFQGENNDMKEVSGDFDEALISFLEDSGFKDKNYMVSPASLRAVLTLAVAGADSDTKSSLLAAMGFSDEEEMNTWYEKVAGISETPVGDMNYKLLNSVWHNTDMPGSISENYKAIIGEEYNAEANDVAGDKITGAVNNWVDEGTEGLIPKMSDDLSQVDLVLVNTMYLKCSWFKEFDEEATTEGDFTTFDGSKVKKDFMEKTQNCSYYEEDGGKLVILPMMGSVRAVFTIGNIDDVCEKVNNAVDGRVHIKLPKFETDSSFSNNEMSEFIKRRGAEIAFTPEADFSVMSSDRELFISDIIQQTKIKVDENGIEAAAATMIAVLGAAFPGNIEEPWEFIADEPFRFYIITETEKPEILFCGQIVE